MWQLSLQQLQTAIAHLDQAIYNHEQWYKNLQRTLIARVPADPSDLLHDAHHRCRFGQWYDCDGAALLRYHPAFVAVGRAHEQMHESGAHLLKLSADEQPITVNDIDEFNSLLDRMRLEIQSLRRELADTAQNRDPLTGARNRTSLLSDLRAQQELVRRGVGECAVVMIDLDHFKEMNDAHGHFAGDLVLTSTSQCLQAQVRPYDRVYRYGGDEFLLLMPQVTVNMALQLAGRLRAAVAAQQIHDAAGAALLVTGSFGVASLAAADPVEESIDRADQAMYRAKVAGGNRVASSV